MRKPGTLWGQAEGPGAGMEEARAARLQRPSGVASQDYADSQGNGGHSGKAGTGRQLESPSGKPAPQNDPQ